MASAACSGLVAHPHRQFVHHFDNANFNLGALFGRTAITQDTEIDNPRQHGVVIKKLKAAISLRNKTTGEGPIYVGLALGLNATEIAEAINADPQSIEDSAEMEQTNRKVFPIWYFGKEVTNNADNSDVFSQMFREIRDFPFRNIQQSFTLRVFAFNADVTALTSGTSIDLAFVAVEEWMRD